MSNDIAAKRRNMRAWAILFGIGGLLTLADRWFHLPSIITFAFLLAYGLLFLPTPSSKLSRAHWLRGIVETVIALIFIALLLGVMTQASNVLGLKRTPYIFIGAMALVTLALAVLRFLFLSGLEHEKSWLRGISESALWFSLLVFALGSLAYFSTVTGIHPSNVLAAGLIVTALVLIVLSCLLREPSGLEPRS